MGVIVKIMFVVFVYRLYKFRGKRLACFGLELRGFGELRWLIWEYVKGEFRFFCCGLLSILCCLGDFSFLYDTFCFCYVVYCVGFSLVWSS